jgi:hypothetical protein
MARFMTLIVIFFSAFTQLQAAGISVKADITFGTGGPIRTCDFIPGEYADIAVKISGISEDASGGSKYKMQLDLIKDGRLLTSIPSPDISTTLHFGGGATKYSASVFLPRTLLPGAYTIRVGVNDLGSGAKDACTLGFVILDPLTFGPMAIRLCHDPKGTQPAGCCYNTGETAYLHFLLNGWSTSKGKVKLCSKVTVGDRDSKPIKPRPIAFSVETDVPEQDVFPAYVEVPLNRAGHFTLLLEVEDLLANTKVQVVIPIVVIDDPTPSLINDTLPGQGR